MNGKNDVIQLYAEWNEMEAFTGLFLFVCLRKFHHEVKWEMSVGECSYRMTK